MDFDAYWECLRIPQDRCPPNHYELLGLAPFEADGERILAAFRERCSLVRKHHADQREEDVRRLISELREARACLADSARKQTYDRELQGLVMPVQEVTGPDDSVPAAGPPPRPSSATSKASGTSTEETDDDRSFSLMDFLQRNYMFLAIGGIGLAVLFLLGMCVTAVAVFSAWRATPASSSPPTREHFRAPPPPPAVALDIPENPQPGPASVATDTLVNSIGTKLALIPPGAFHMVSLEDEEGRRPAEEQRLVQITKPFHMGVYEVTRAEYERVMGTQPSIFSARGPRNDVVREVDTERLPVENVSWNDAVDFCRRLSELPGETQAGLTYRLPTEAEWEYACRGGTTTPFHFGSQLTGREANCDGSKPYRSTGRAVADAGPNVKRPTPVGSYPPNAFGLYDMHGNVMEWCQDWYAPGYRLLPTSESDPRGPSEDTGKRVIRGGSWSSPPEECRSAYRTGFPPQHKFPSAGFRVVAVPSEPIEDVAEPIAENDKRIDPELFPARDLEVQPGVIAALAIQDGATRGSSGLGFPSRRGGDLVGARRTVDGSHPALRTEQLESFDVGFRARSGMRAVGSAFVVVRGLVPVVRQQQEYDRCLPIRVGNELGTDGSAARERPHDSPHGGGFGRHEEDGFGRADDYSGIGRRATRDQPCYIYFYVERQEVAADGKPLGSGKTPDGQPVTWQKLNTRAAQQRVKEWPAVEEPADPRYVDPQLTMQPPPVLLLDYIPFVMHSAVPLAGQQEQSVKGPPRPERKPPTIDMPAGVPDFGTPSRGAPEHPGLARREGGLDDDAQAPAEYRLFRYYDFDVDPTKRYRYRLKLVLEDPNNPRDEQFGPGINSLHADVVARLEEQRQADSAGRSHRRTFWRETEWSEESKIVDFPPLRHVLAGEVVAATTLDVPGTRTPMCIKDAEATVMALVWDAKQATWVPGIADGIGCGSVVDFSKDVWALDPVSLSLRKMSDYRFNSGHTVVDLSGGDSLSGQHDRDELTAPGEILLADEDGNLRVCSELSDASTYRQFFYGSLEMLDLGDLAEATLARLDKNGDHKIDPSEADSTIAPAFAKKVLREFDRNGDNKLSLSEIRRYFAVRPARRPKSTDSRREEHDELRLLLEE